ncbi:MAG: APC family permease [Planctomycetota bacterium]
MTSDKTNSSKKNISSKGDAIDPPPADESSSSTTRLRRILLGAPRDLADKSLFHKLTLIPFLAWVGLGADGLSSSCYGPEEAYKYLSEQNHTYLALGLAFAVAATVLIISTAYSKIIEAFPYGGGGYVVATKLLGEKAGVVSGCALLIDYVLTITTSVAAAGSALYSFLPASFAGYKLTTEVVIIMTLTWMNLRGVRESVIAMTPVFILFLVSHALLILGGFVLHIPQVSQTATEAANGLGNGISTIGFGALAIIFLHAYSLGGGTFTGIEAVSNGLHTMREPRVQTAKRTMLYMAVSLAILSAGLLFCFLLWKVEKVEGKSMNAVLLESVTSGIPGAQVIIIITLISEAAILIIASQTGFLGGPKILASMAVDSWLPHRFGALSERLTTQNGILLMGGAALVALLYTGGSVSTLVIMYSINVFATFSLSMFGMLRMWLKKRRSEAHWRRTVALFAVGFVLTSTILTVTVIEKFMEGGWVTLLVTGSLIALCFLIKRHYDKVRELLRMLGEQLGNIPESPASAPFAEPNPEDPTAVVLVESYGGSGIHTLLNIFRAFPGHFKNLVFVSVGVIDSAGFKGHEEIETLEHRTEETLKKYVALSNRLGIPATYRMEVGTDVVDEAEQLCLQVRKEFPRSTFFAGKVVFQRDRWYQRFLHNETPFAIQKRLVWSGATMVVLPVRLRWGTGKD